MLKYMTNVPRLRWPRKCVVSSAADSPCAAVDFLFLMYETTAMEPMRTMYAKNKKNADYQSNDATQQIRQHVVRSCQDPGTELCRGDDLCACFARSSVIQ